MKKKPTVTVSRGDLADLPVQMAEKVAKRGGICITGSKIVVVDVADTIDLVCMGLKHISGEGHVSASLSVVLNGARTAEDAIDDIDSALERFRAEVSRTSIETISVVVYDVALALQN